MSLPRTSTPRVIEVAHDLVGIERSADYFRHAPSALARLIPADQVIWAMVDFSAKSATVHGATDADTAVLAAGLARFGHTHQGVRSFELRPRDRSPRRISDVASQSEWHRTPLYNEAYRQFGPAHQLGLMTGMHAIGRGAGWTFTRSSSDFTDEEVEIAGLILPVLIALERVHGHRAPPSAISLRPRETVLLNYLAAGHTARSIGSQMGISERTVRKHLGSLYVTLGCNDRLVAVQRAIEWGLLRP